MPLPPLLLERLKQKKALSELRHLPPPPEQKRKKKSSGLAAEYSYQDANGPSVVESEMIASNSGGGGDVDELEEEIIAEDYSDDEHGAKVMPEIIGANEQNKYAELSNCDKISSAKVSRNRLESDEKRENGLANQVTTKRKDSVLGCPNKYNIYHECSQYCEDKYDKPEALEPTLEQRKQLAMILRTYPMSNEWTVVYDPGVRTFYFWNIITNLVSWFPPAMKGFVSLPANQIRKSIKEMELI